MEFYRIIERSGDNSCDRWIRTCSTPSGIYTALANARNARSQLANMIYRPRNAFPRRQRVIQKLHADGVNELRWYDVDVKLD